MFLKYPIDLSLLVFQCGKIFFQAHLNLYLRGAIHPLTKSLNVLQLWLFFGRIYSIDKLAAELIYETSLFDLRILVNANVRQNVACYTFDS